MTWTPNGSGGYDLDVAGKTLTVGIRKMSLPTLYAHYDGVLDWVRLSSREWSEAKVEALTMLASKGVR